MDEGKQHWIGMKCWDKGVSGCRYCKNHKNRVSRSRENREQRCIYQVLLIETVFSTYIMWSEWPRWAQLLLQGSQYSVSADTQYGANKVMVRLDFHLLPGQWQDPSFRGNRVILKKKVGRRLQRVKQNGIWHKSPMMNTDSVGLIVSHAQLVDQQTMAIAQYMQGLKARLWVQLATPVVIRT